MDRDVLDVIEPEIDDEVRTRFPGAAVRQEVLLQHGDDHQIEPRDLWLRVLLDSGGPQDYERSWKAFAGAHQAAIEEFPRYLAEEWERGQATFVRAPMGPAGLETLDKLILAGIAYCGHSPE